MKGAIPASGTGWGLYPLTKISNRHPMPVYSERMIFYPVRALINAGVTEILVVTDGHNSGDFLLLLSNGKEFGLRHLNLTYQEGEAGIADALKLAEYFAGGEKICVMLGDNIIEGNIAQAVERFKRQTRGVHIILKEIPVPQRFGVPVFKGERIIRIEEKPEDPPSPYAVTGIYFYDSSVFERIKRLKPSRRGELEITDVNNSYLGERTLTYSVLEDWWTDAGTFESLRSATNLVAETGANKLHLEAPGQVAAAVEARE